LALQDPLYPRSLPGGVRDAWASLVRNARTLNVVGGEVDDVVTMDATDGVLGASGTITAAMIQSELAKTKAHEDEEYSLNRGQLAVACRTVALKSALQRESELNELLEKKSSASVNALAAAREEVKEIRGVGNEKSTGGCAALLSSFYERIRQVKEYHSRNVVDGSLAADSDILDVDGHGGAGAHSMQFSGQKRKHGHPLADGYDIASLVATETSSVRSGEVFTPEEMFGKYLDLLPIYEEEVRNMRYAFASFDKHSNGDAPDKIGGSTTVSVVSYLDFLTTLSKGLNTSIAESSKLKDRRKYARFLRQMETYLVGFLKRTSPFLDAKKEVINPAISSFDNEWGEKGGVDGWECRMAEALMVTSTESNSAKDENGTNNANASIGIDLKKYATASDLEKDVSGDELKSELVRLGLKCGGTVSDRAARLFLTKDTPLDKLPAKVFAKKKGGGPNPKSDITAEKAVPSRGMNGNVSKDLNNSRDVSADRRVDLARLETIVSALLDQLRPTLEGTRRRIERRTTQTDNERDQEIDEDINGARIDNTNANLVKKSREGGNGSADEEDDEDDDDAPIYNPKNVPLGWDGKPIPYWLFKLHGLNHFYPCEICGNESYRGRRNFEKHFTESRHAYGMRCLGIPNTKHFHGVTKIEDAQELWNRLKRELEGNRFDGDEEEEYEDSHGNVLNRAQYEDLARQGLL